MGRGRPVKQKALVWLWCLGWLAILPQWGCGALPFSPYEVRLDPARQDQTRKNLRRLAGIEPTDAFRLAVIADSHYWETEARAAVDAINRRDDISFAIHVGDITHVGMAKEYRWLDEFFSRLDVPFFTVIGNHDQLSNGKAIYEAMYGGTNYSFYFRRIKFVFLDNNSREYSFDGSVPDLGFLERELGNDGSYDQAVVVSHVPPWDGDADPRLTPRFVEILQEGGVRLSIHGHVHEYVDAFPYGPDVRYVSADALLNRNFLIVSITPEGTTVEQVFY